jgi:hypothetical protein
MWGEVCREDLRGPTEGPRSPLPCERGGPTGAHGGPRSPACDGRGGPRGPTGAHGSRLALPPREGRRGGKGFEQKGNGDAETASKHMPSHNWPPKKDEGSRGKDGGERKKSEERGRRVRREERKVGGEGRNPNQGTTETGTSTHPHACMPREEACLETRCGRGAHGGPRGPTVACFRYARGPTGAHGGPRSAAGGEKQRRQAKGKHGGPTVCTREASPAWGPRSSALGERKKAMGGPRSDGKSGKPARGAHGRTEMAGCWQGAHGRSKEKKKQSIEGPTVEAAERKGKREGKGREGKGKEKKGKERKGKGKGEKKEASPWGGPRLDGNGSKSMGGPTVGPKRQASPQGAHGRPKTAASPWGAHGRDRKRQQSVQGAHGRPKTAASLQGAHGRMKCRRV